MACLKAPLALGMIAFMQLASVNAQTNWAREFKVKDGVIYADGKPFPLIMDFTWGAESSVDLCHYWARMGGTSHLILNAAIHFAAKQEFDLIDRKMELAAQSGLYAVVTPAVAGFGFEYYQTRPDAAMKGPDGKDVSRRYPSFTHEGYRAEIAKALKELAAHCKDKPYFLGYYLQDEFSYPGWGGFEAVAVNIFRDKMMTQYGTLEKLNSAWGTNYGRKEDIAPPEKPEAGRRFADGQLFRRWAYADLVRVCYQALKEADPNHLVINSMDFWPSQAAASAWWIVPPYVDILMRHGISYALGYNFMVVRDIAEWSGKAGSALCMPPGGSPSFIHFMHLLDASRNGLSYVCVAGETFDGHYRGPADSADGFRRREPQYTTAKAIIQLQHYLGAAYLTSKRRPPQVGFLVGDRTVSIAGVNGGSVAGMLELLTDLNLDFEVVSEHNYAPLKRFQVIIAGPAIRLAADEMTAAVNEYRKGGGALILLPGAFERDEWNMAAPPDRFADLRRFGKASSCTALVADGVTIPLKDAKVSPVEVGLSDKVLARISGRTNAAAAVISADGKALFLGWDIGSMYMRSWSEDCAGMGEDDATTQGALRDNAFGSDAGDLLKVPTAAGLKPQRQIAVWIQEFLAGRKATPSVVVRGQEAPGLIHAKSFAAGSDLWLGIANRAVKPGQNLKGSEWDIEQSPDGGGAWPADFHVPITNAAVSIQLPPDFPDKLRCFRMPNMTVEGGRLSAMPAELPVETARTETGKFARFSLSRIDDWAAVVLSPGYRPLAGMEIERREVVKGSAVRVRMSLLNATDKNIQGALILKDEDGLCRERPAAIPYKLRPGETKTAGLTLPVAANVKAGHYSLKTAALESNGTTAESMSLEVRILEPAIIVITPTGGYLFAKPDRPARLEVKTVLRDEIKEGKITALLEGFTIFPFESKEQAWTVDGAREHTFVFTVKSPHPENVTEAGTMVVREDFAGGLKREWAQPVRVTAGAVAYQEIRKGKPDNKGTGMADIEFACLENEHLIARIMISNGVLHNLTVRRTGMELLSPGSYPFGLVWYNRQAGWKLDKMEAGQATLSTGAYGKPISMTAVLGAGREFIDVLYDAAVNREPGTLNQAESFYLMSRIGTAGILTDNVMHVPLSDKVRELKWGAGALSLDAEEIHGPWLAVEDKRTQHILATFFDGPVLKKILAQSGRAGFNYEIFYLKDNVPPGKTRFRLCGARGGLEKIPEWEAMWRDSEQ